MRSTSAGDHGPRPSSRADAGVDRRSGSSVPPTSIDGDLLCRIGRQSQGGPRRPGTGSDDQRCRHGAAQVVAEPGTVVTTPRRYPWRPKVGMVLA